VLGLAADDGLDTTDNRGGGVVEDRKPWFHPEHTLARAALFSFRPTIHTHL
jgi:hypothetical protein